MGSFTGGGARVGMNKKGVFYFFIAIVFTSALMLLFMLSQADRYTESQDAVEARVNTMDDFIRNLNNDIKKATYVSAYRALIAMEEEVMLRGEYFNDTESVFKEAFYNGTINGDNKTVLNASSFSDYLARVNQEASDIGISLDIDVTGIHLYHDDPWNVLVEINYSNHVVDRKGLAVWDYEKSVKREIPIISLRDPLYSVGTDGKVPNTIQKTNVSRFINDTDNANDTTNLMVHTNNSFYISEEGAPNYIMRFEGNFSNATYGIESLVNIEELEAQGLDIKSDRSIVDHVYFEKNLTNASDVCDSIINTPDWFKIDEPRVRTYEIDPKLNPEGVGYVCP